MTTNIDFKIFNNLSRKKEIFKPIEGNKVKFYSCGPTTYDFLHVGNARALVVGDLFHRVLEFFNFDVTFVRNFTDVDDKIIDKARELGVNPLEHSAHFVDECKQDMLSLGMKNPDHTPKVSECMPEIIKMIQDIIDSGSGYVVNGEVLYDVQSFKEYGKLSKKDLESLQHGIRVEVDSHKKHPSDFVLWKPAKENEPAWDSPWGKGRPGWHIECSAMAKKFLGKTLDLHHGGVDLMFPHHENEIAQSEAANNCPFCQVWAHNEFLNMSGEKMSKSLGNLVTIRSFIKEFSGQILRQILISVHYRARLDWNDELIEKAIQDVERIHEFSVELDNAKTSDTIKEVKHKTEIENFYFNFCEELKNDFNSAGALGNLFSLIRFVRREILSKESSLDEIKFIKEMVQKMNEPLGFLSNNPKETLLDIQRIRQKNSQTKSGRLSDEEILSLIERRKEAKKSKNWQEADEIRKKLEAAGIQVKDNPDGTVTWKYN